MNLTFYLVFFILLTSCCFTSALKCYRCVEENPDADLSNGFCSSLDNLNSWEMVECSGSCFSGYSTVQGHRVGQRFINQTYFCNIICMYCLNCYCFSLKTNFEIGTWIDYSKKNDEVFFKNFIIHFGYLINLYGPIISMISVSLQNINAYKYNLYYLQLDTVNQTKCLMLEWGKYILCYNAIWNTIL